MSQFHFSHVTPLARRTKPEAGVLPPEQFGLLVGILDHLTLNAFDGSRPDINHVYLWLNINHGPQGGRYECAFNTESLEKTEVQYCVHEEGIKSTDIPTPGFWSAEVSYQGLGLRQADFSPITEGQLRSLVYHYAEESNIIGAYGLTYAEGNGIHDIHMNSGETQESKHSNRKNQDGALIFYFRHETTSCRRAWVFIKFQTQTFS